MEDDISNPLLRSYSFSLDEKYLKKKFTEDEKAILRPIAETLALLDGNAFFTFKNSNDGEWYEQYLPEAATIFYDNGGLKGWAGMVSWIRDQIHENESVREAYISWQTLKKLSQP